MLWVVQGVPPPFEISRKLVRYFALFATGSMLIGWFWLGFYVSMYLAFVYVFSMCYVYSSRLFNIVVWHHTRFL